MKYLKPTFTLCLSIFFLLIFSTVSIAQSVSKIAGKVLNNKNEPIAGVSVSVEDAKTGTATNQEGRFVIASSAKNITLHLPLLVTVKRYSATCPPTKATKCW